MPRMKHVFREVRVENGSRSAYFTALVASEEGANTVQTAKAPNSPEASGSVNVRIDPSAVSQTKRSPTVAANASP